MIVADLIHRAADAGISMIYRNGALQLYAERQPPPELLAKLIAHKVEIIAALSAANDPIPPTAWLSHVARLLGTSPIVLLGGGHLDEHDLAELAGTDAALVADTIRVSPTWINRPQGVEQPAEVHLAEQLELQHITPKTSRAWREADAAYTNHLMNCRACHSATSRYCVAGADLRQRYKNTPME